MALARVVRALGVEQKALSLLSAKCDNGGRNTERSYTERSC